ncbi:MAG TPA: methyltransferase domain-containing protein [Polyangia bacterium]|jgi:SAM-dependent methyltransferase|nr:methyltransferase domain-containing protein [Polyangia bacterium]
MIDGIAAHAVCPNCRTRLDTSFTCTPCNQLYPRMGTIRILLPAPSDHLERWRMQLGLVIQQADETARVLRRQATEAGIDDATRTRLQGLAGAVADQVTDIALVLGPSLGGPLLPLYGVPLPRGVTDYVSCIFRDWAWSDGYDQENVQSVAAIRRVTGGTDLGRILVLGAGACRLAYDLHVHCGGTETVVVDVDPYLLGVAEAVIRGGVVSLTESSVNAPEVDPVCRRWSLTAPSGPLSEAVFHFFLADGTEPPFLDHAFDTIVTPWFIDQVPTDLEGLIRRLHRLLAPRGRWINHGPLIYRPDALPVARWYTRQEIFNLSTAIGFHIRAWERTTLPHFVSPLSGRGLLENVLTFEASRE